MTNTYCLTYTITAGQPSTSGYLVLNNVYNPFGTVLPNGNTTGWAEMSMLYDKCLVYGAKITCVLQNANAYTMVWDQIGMDMDQVALPGWTYDFNEIKGVKRVILRSAPAATADIPGSSITKTNTYYSLKRIKGQKLDENDCVEIRTSFTPVHQYQCQFYLGHLDGTGKADTVTVLANIRIKQYVKWMQPSIHLFNH